MERVIGTQKTTRTRSKSKRTCAGEEVQEREVLADRGPEPLRHRALDGDRPLPFPARIGQKWNYIISMAHFKVRVFLSKCSRIFVGTIRTLCMVQENLRQPGLDGRGPFPVRIGTKTRPQRL